MKEQVAVSMAGLMLLTAGCENADGKNPFNTLASSMNTTKSKKVAAQDVGEKNIHNQWEGKSNPSLYRGGFFARGDFLYWRADQDGLEYAVELKQIASTSDSKNRVLKPEVQWNAGFRVGLGYTFSSQDYWDLMALWTHFNTHLSGSKSVNFNLNGQNNSAIIPWWGASLLGSFGNEGSVDWKLHYNTYDLDLGRNYFVSKTFSVHPFIGIRGATIKQNYHASYRIALIPTSFDANLNFWGIGAHIGTALQWHCTRSFSFLGNFGGSLLYGNTKIQEETKGLVIGSPTQTSKAKLNEHLTGGSVNLDAMVGFQWEKFFYENKYRLSIVAGYEWSEWFAQNRIIKADLVPSLMEQLPANLFNKSSGNLMLQGANLQLRLDF
jgi:hypothetical protein